MLPPAVIFPALHGLVTGAVVAVAVALALPACGTATANATLGPEADGGLPSFADAGDGSIVLLPDGAPAFCQGAGPAIALPDGTCTGDVGKKTFLFAVCACSSMGISGTMRTDSVDSALGKSAGNGASIGVTGALDTESDLTLQGSVYAAGVGAVTAATFKRAGTITRDLRAGGPVRVDQAFRVDGDLYAASDVGGAGALTCGGKAHVAPGHAAPNVTATGGTVTEAVSVAPPCDCSNPLDVAGLVSAFASRNDDAALGITSTTLVSAPAAPLVLPCGRYYFDAIGGGHVALQLAGRTAIFVAGNVSVTGLLQVTLAPSAELDLFIAGDLTLADAALGSTLAAARVRVYVGGANVQIAGRAKLGTNLYAPRADVAIASDYEMSGALFVKSLALSGNFTIHYDEAILDTVGCQGDAHGCATCHDCAGAAPACKGGACVPCAVTADCCAPLQCVAGRCVPDIR